MQRTDRTEDQVRKMNNMFAIGMFYFEHILRIFTDRKERLYFQNSVPVILSTGGGGRAASREVCI